MTSSLGGNMPVNDATEVEADIFQVLIQHFWLG